MLQCNKKLPQLDDDNWQLDDANWQLDDVNGQVDDVDWQLDDVSWQLDDTNWHERTKLGQQRCNGPARHILQEDVQGFLALLSALRVCQKSPGHALQQDIESSAVWASKE